MDDVAVYLTPMVRAWQCKKRGLCCTHHRVQVDEVERRRIERALTQAGDPLAAALGADGERRDAWPLLPMAGQRCGFLRDDNLCSLRTRFGEGLYPRVCKKFPFLSIYTGERQVVGL